MLEIIENLMKFIYTHKKVRELIYYFIISTAGFLLFVFVLLNINIGVQKSNLSLLFNSQTYYYLFNIYQREIAIFLIIEQIILLSFIYYQNHKLNQHIKNSKKDELQVIHIKDLSKLWIEEESIILNDPLKQSLKRKYQPLAHTKNEDLLSIAHFKNDNIILFLEKSIKPYLNILESEELKAIVKLLHILEDNSKVPSVVPNKNDPNATYGFGHLKNIVEPLTLDGKTRFDIFYTISLLDHTLEVARNTIDTIESNKNFKKKDILAQAIISALAHDIGKIEKYKMQDKSKDFIALKEQPHHVISNIILYDSFKTLPNLDQIAKAVINHHSGAIAKEDVLLKLLVDCDKQTREKEIHSYLVKYNAFESNKAVTFRKNIFTQLQTLEEKNNYSLLIIESKDEQLKSTAIKEFIQDESIINFSNEDNKLIMLIQEKSKNKIMANILTPIISFCTEEGIFIKTILINLQDIEYLDKTYMKNIIKELFDHIQNKETNFIHYADYKKIKHSKISISDNSTTEESKTHSEDKSSKSKEIITQIKDKLQTKTAQENQEKILQLKTDESAEEGFDIQNIEKLFLDKLKNKINTVEYYGFKSEINSISYKKFVLFKKECLIKTLGEIISGDNESLDRKINYLIKYYKNHQDENKRLIWFVNTNNGFYKSLYYIYENNNKELFYCVPFEAKLAFNLDSYELEKIKEKSDLKKYSIGKYKGEKNVAE
ncbi:HD domain-containing protein [Campylobacter lari]|uniref:HD domain-containing protein n=1 Tax=Campylobacter lari TaxID=201 RepID=UPI00214A7434|nr:HD domain-containing protein [Campylobacter lari subsp. concheus]MCR2083899.1 HD domain-containing protein [Campylobacter lari subsp. concheus]MCR2085524.1 HD domain-containing protein [Campylobacter lari subsp. concheus]